MLPIKHSTIFKSRWWALIWAAGICWTAIEVAQGASGDGNTASEANASAQAGSPGDDQPDADADAARKAAALLGQIG